MTDSFDEWRTKVASSILYRWACDKITTREAKKQCKRLAGFDVDFRQPDIGAYVHAFDIASGNFVEIHF